jgi:hypothetical protein
VAWCTDATVCVPDAGLARAICPATARHAAGMTSFQTSPLILAMEVRTLLPSVMAWRWQVTTNPRSWRGCISRSEIAGEEFSNLGMPGQGPSGQLCSPCWPVFVSHWRTRPAERYPPAASGRPTGQGRRSRSLAPATGKSGCFPSAAHELFKPALSRNRGRTIGSGSSGAADPVTLSHYLWSARRRNTLYAAVLRSDHDHGRPPSRRVPTCQAPGFSGRARKVPAPALEHRSSSVCRFACGSRLRRSKPFPPQTRRNGIRRTPTGTGISTSMR